MTDIIENNAISESVNLKLSLMDMFPVEFSPLSGGSRVCGCIF